jgi:heterodisulfide reductase subunit C
MLKVDSEFYTLMKLPASFNASECILCGQCSVICPIGIDLNPRLLFRYVLLGIEEKVVENSENIFKCLLCRMCEVDCKAGVHIAENIRALRTYINRDIHRITRG